MLNRKETTAIVLFAGLAIGAGWLDRLSATPIAQPIKAAGENYKETEAPINDSSSPLGAVFIPTGSFIHTYKDEITALSTVVIAIFTTILGCFTIGLSRSTRKAANAASRQATAAIALESPIPSIHQIKLVGYPNETDTVGDTDPIPPGLPPDICRPGVWIKNHGRTNMYLDQWACDWLVARTLPPNPSYQRVAPLDGFLPSESRVNNGTWVFNFDHALRLNAQERTEIQNGNAYLWVFGYVAYRNFVGDSFLFGFMPGGIRKTVSYVSPIAITNTNVAAKDRPQPGAFLVGPNRNGLSRRKRLKSASP